MPSLNTGNAILSNAITVDGSYNVGIGTSTPLGKLHVSSPTAVSAYIVSSGGDYDTNLYLGYGSVYTDTYIKRVVGNLSLGTSATDRVYITSGGNVGIGTTSPTGTYGKLSVAGGIAILDDNNAKLEIGRYSSGASNSYIKLGANSNSLRFTNAADSVDLVTFTNSGNVGIGTSSPTGKLMVYGSSAGNVFTSVVSNQGGSTQVGINFAPSMTDTEFASNPAQASIYATDSNYGANIIFANKSVGAVGNSLTERMRITSSGNVGIGTSSPNAKLNVVGNNSVFLIDGGGSSVMYQTFNSSGGNYYIGISSSTGAGLLGGQNAYSMCLVTESARDMSFGTSNTERMRITSGGRLLVGTSSVISGSYSVQASGTAGFVTNGTGSGDANYYSVSSTIAWHFYAESSGATKFYVLNNGDVKNANNSYGAISDISLKENITDATPKLADLLKVKVRNYNLIADEKKEKQLGVIAQELEEIFPNMISEDIQMGSEEKIKTVKYSVFVPMLIKAIQEQNEIITKQGQAIEELKALINK